MAVLGNWRRELSIRQTGHDLSRNVAIVKFLQRPE
jgi:hypothetical protein